MDTEELERWFMRRGLPHADPGFSTTEDVWTRAWPFLVAVLFLETFASFDDDVTGWKQALTFVIGIGITTAAFAIFNRVRGWPWFGLPDRIGTAELTFFVVAPAVITFIVSGEAARPLAIAAVNLILLGVSYLVISYGLVPAVRIGARQAGRQLRTVVQLIARSLPMLLIITAFIFLNAEMWQVAHELTNAYLAIILAGFISMAIAFLLLQTPRETTKLATFASWTECAAMVRRTDAPIEFGDDDLTGPVPSPDLPRAGRINVALALTMSQLVQAILVGLITSGFYLAFGLLAVRRETLLQWTTTTSLDDVFQFDFIGSEIIITREHLAVAAFVGAFSVLQFAVSSVTDSSYRDQFYDEVADDVREVLAVRTMYLRLDERTATP